MTAIIEIDRTDGCTVVAALSLYVGEGMGDPARRPPEIHDIATDCGNLGSSLDDWGSRELLSRVRADVPAAGGTGRLDLDEADFCTALAALALYDGRGMGEPSARPDRIHALATDGGALASSLDHAGIEELMERMQAAALGFGSPDA